MKNNFHFNLLITLSLLFSINSDINAQCPQGNAQTELEANNVRARLQIGGDFWWDSNDGGYFVPKPEEGAPEVSAIFSGGLWMGGFDPGGNLKLSAQTYGSNNGSSDYWPGPLNEQGEALVDQCINFDRFWQIGVQEVNQHIADFEEDGLIDGAVPFVLMGWPGVGNPQFFDYNGFELPFSDSGLAPFIDRNNNGIYEPLEGDYPDIKGADQAIWWVFNDAGNIHTQSDGDQIKMETQVMAYSYSSSDETINSTTFYDLRFIHRASESLEDAYVGLWIDFDLGCFSDDMVGCDPENNLAYVYNADALDGVNSCNDCQGVYTYCEDIPILGVKILEGLKTLENGQLTDQGMSSFMSYHVQGDDPIPFEAISLFENPIGYYNLLNGIWANGIPMTYGGNGYNLNSTFVTKFAFPDAPDDPNGWSMCTESFTGADVSTVISSGPVTFQPGSVNSMCFAVIYADDIAYPCPSLNPFSTAVETIENFYTNVVLSNEELAKEPANIEIFPSPMSDQATLFFNELENEVLSIDLFAMDGKQVRSYERPAGNSLLIEREQLSAGVYFYKLLTKDYKIHSGKFIVQ